MKYNPNSVLLDSLYIPFLSEKNKNVKDCSGGDNFSVELDSNGLPSIIDLSTSTGSIFPYIDVESFDPLTKSWFWYDYDGLQYRLKYIGYNNKWELTPTLGISSYNPNYSIYIYIDNNFFDKYAPNKLGVVTKGYFYDGSSEVSVDSSYQYFYEGSPLVVTIDDNILIDRTHYFSKSNPVLATEDVDTNREFYYNFEQNKIFTNQNLFSTNPNRVKIYFNSINNQIKVKCRLNSNLKNESTITPTVDYYILKLNGQNIRYN